MNRVMPFILFALVVYISLLYSRVNTLEELRAQEKQAMQTQISELESEIERLKAPSASYLRDSSLNREGLAKLKSGLYSTNLQVKVLNPAETHKSSREFTLYHVKEFIVREDKTYPFNIGIAFSGITSIPLFYIDYDNDGNIDMDIMQEFAYFLPGGRILAKSIDAQKAQAVYDKFLSQVDKATYYSSSQISDSGSKLSRQLWDFVHDKSKELSKWIESHAPSDPKILP